MEEQNQLKVEKLKYFFCNKNEEHEDEQLNLICIDPKHPQKNFQLLCNLCQEEDFQGLKTKNLKSFMKTLKSQITPQENQEDGDQQNIPMNDQLQALHYEALSLADYYKKMSERFISISQQIELQLKKTDNSNGATNLIQQILKSKDADEQKQNFLKLNEFVILQDDGQIEIDQNMDDLIAFMDKMRSCQEYIEPKLDSLVKISQLEQDNEETEEKEKFLFDQLQDPGEKYKQMEQELQQAKDNVSRLEQQRLSNLESIEMWKQKYKMNVGNQNESKNYNEELAKDRLFYYNKCNQQQNHILQLEAKLNKYEDTIRKFQQQRKQQQQQQQQRTRGVYNRYSRDPFSQFDNECSQY